MSNCQNCQWPHMLKNMQTSNWIISPTLGMKMQKYLSCHHPARLPEKHLGFGGMTGGPQKHTIQTIKPQEGFAWNMRGWILRKELFFFTGSMGTYMNLPETSSTSRYCIPFIDPICFFDILLGKWYILRWIRQVPKTTRMYCFFSIWNVLGFAGLALGKCSKHTLPNGGAYLVGGFNPPEKY